jgi:aryl-alcohol dehydrogenase-like predicted oxidoreductase
MTDDVRNESDTFDIGGELTVHRLGFGAMRLTGEGIIGRPDDEAEAREIVHRATELGVDFVDTADSYGPGVSERILREAVAEIDADPVVASKAGLLRHREGEWLPHGDPDYLHNQVLCSLDRLGVDSIDLYQFHRPDPDTDFEDSVHAFAEMKDAGQVDHVGLSNVSVEQLDLARDIVDIATVQNQYNVAYRGDEDVLAACEEYDVGFIPWGPLYTVDDDGVAGVLDEVGEAHDASRRQVALAWLLRHSDVTLPIPGTSSVDHLESNVAASEVELTGEDLAKLNEIDAQ